MSLYSQPKLCNHWKLLHFLELFTRLHTSERFFQINSYRKGMSLLLCNFGRPNWLLQKAFRDVCMCIKVWHTHTQNTEIPLDYLAVGVNGSYLSGFAWHTKVEVAVVKPCYLDSHNTASYNPATVIYESSHRLMSCRKSEVGIHSCEWRF